VLLQQPVAESLYARLTRAEIHVIHGEFADAERLLEEIRRRPSPDPRFIGPLYSCIAEAAAWQNKPGEAREAVTAGLAAIASTHRDRALAQLRAVGLRVAADLKDVAWADGLAAKIRSIGAEETPDIDELKTLIRLGHAEHARAHGSDMTETWGEIAYRWTALDQPLRRAYAQARQAAAAARCGARAQAGTAIRLAYATAEELAAQPLRALVQALATEQRLRPGRPRLYDLTDAEMKVLRKLHGGLTNKEIAKELFLSPNTISVHVSSILHKMGARSRFDAARRAGEHGLFTD
jgi:DNA-binding CsgD family transcriptional regulator